MSPMVTVLQVTGIHCRFFLHQREAELQKALSVEVMLKSEVAEVFSMETLPDWLSIEATLGSLWLDQNPVLLFLLQKMIPLQLPFPTIITTDKKCSRSGDTGMMEEEEKPFLQSLSKSP